MTDSSAAQESAAINTPLIDGVLWLANFFELSNNRESITAGLPLPGGDLSLAHFADAATRAGLHSRRLQIALTELDATALPCLLAIEGMPPTILLKLDNNSATLLDPMSHGELTWSRAELDNRYQGNAIFVKPDYQPNREADNNSAPESHWFWGPIKRSRTLYRDIVAASLIINLFALVSPLFVMNVYDRILPNLAYDSLWVLATGAGIAYLFDLILKQVRGSLIDYAGKQTDLSVSRSLFSRVMGMQMHHRPASTGALARQFSDFDSVREFIASTTITTLVDLPFSILFILIIGWVSGPLVWPPIAAIVIMIIVTALLQKKMAHASQEAQRFADLRHSHLFESITGLETIKSSGAEGAIQYTWEQMQAHSAKWQMESRKLTNLASNFSAFIMQFTAVVTIILGVYSLEAGLLSMGGIIAAVILSSRAISPMSQLIGLLSRAHNVRATLNQLDSLMQLPQEIDNKRHYPDIGKLSGKISATELSFTYPNQESPSLKELNFNIEPGQRVAVIGRNGSGKSTLIKMVLGLFRTEQGSLRLDNSNINQLHSNALRRQIGYVPQDIRLFSGTIHENIVLGCRNISNQQLQQAIERSGVSLFTNLDSEGINRQVGESGLALSVGQRQAIALARALLTDPPILVLDEPTASLDARAELQFMRTIQQLPRDKTILLVTHKQPLMDLVDRLMVLERGRLIAQGPRQQVLDKLRNNGAKRGEQ
ncbi:type I secretion system permease/ATPase [Ferrimonas lipolytica]|uniref:Type I secretion system permease/ATPase n=1 Tax=Ferrimonas lipolytica TaxID=2724191 RepID=A0A6H1UHD8_9GAMM|nr:type I secretion system permease/ATPase [Ferrimonas lipolytica]QIZ78020.1 type I secretion system permease/ATPase [Ferrimonas lipolytica]